MGSADGVGFAEGVGLGVAVRAGVGVAVGPDSVHAVAIAARKASRQMMGDVLSIVLNFLGQACFSQQDLEKIGSNSSLELERP